MLARYGERATIVRPGKVAGPHDWQDGLTYWVRRAARGGPVAVPTDPAQPVQVIDSRDLARLVVQLIADDRPGAFHAVGPAEPVTLGGLIQTCARVAGTQVEIVPVPPAPAPDSSRWSGTTGRDSGAARPRPGPRACPPPRSTSPWPTCWPGTGSAASRRWRTASLLSRSRPCCQHRGSAIRARSGRHPGSANRG